MTVAETHDAYESGEAPIWAWPLYAFVAWLAGILGYITRFKRARRFRRDWRDSWDDLRQSEWLRDQLIAQGLAQLLAGQKLTLDDTKITLAPSATYGGPCPRTPFEMNRRFLALARWAADPEAIIRERFKRVSRDAPVAHGSTGALRAAHHEAAGVATFDSTNARVALILSSDRRERPSKEFAATAQPANWSGGPIRAADGGLTKARGPPPKPNSQLTPNTSARPRV